MKKEIASHFNTAKQIHQDRGLAALVSWLFSWLGSKVFFYEKYYIGDFEIEKLRARKESDFLPRIEQYEFKIICSLEEMKTLFAKGMRVHPWFSFYDKKLEKGALAFCILVGEELASIRWLAMDEHAKEAVDSLPYEVDFSKGEICSGSNWTNPKYRNRGLASYIDFKLFDFLVKEGKSVHRAAMRKANAVAGKVYAKRGQEIQTEARLIKFLWWKSWKEKPLEKTVKL